MTSSALVSISLLAIGLIQQAYILRVRQAPAMQRRHGQTERDRAARTLAERPALQGHSRAESAQVAAPCPRKPPR